MARKTVTLTLEDMLQKSCRFHFEWHAILFRSSAETCTLLKINWAASRSCTRTAWLTPPWAGTFPGSPQPSSGCRTFRRRRTRPCRSPANCETRSTGTWNFARPKTRTTRATCWPDASTEVCCYPLPILSLPTGESGYM